MGSFDVACSVSRITISGGDPVAYMPLELYHYAYDPRAENNTLIYPWCYYVPACLPIFGKYFDYGYIDEIEEDCSTKAIEKHFGRTIKGVCGGDGQLQKNKQPTGENAKPSKLSQKSFESEVRKWG